MVLSFIQAEFFGLYAVPYVMGHSRYLGWHNNIRLCERNCDWRIAHKFIPFNRNFSGLHFFIPIGSGD